MNLSAFFLALASPMVARVLVALGITVTTLTGVTAAYGSLKASIEAGVNSAPAAALQLAALAGVPQGLGMVLGAITFLISLWTTTAATKLVFR